MPPLPAISSLSSLPTDRRVQVLDTLFEPCTQIHTLSLQLLRENQFASYDSLIDTVARQLYSLSNSPSKSDIDWLDAILNAHPRVGETKVGRQISSQEQAHLRSEDDAEEMREIAVLNNEYEKAYSGLRYILFVNGRTRGTIIENMRYRIARADKKQEREEAIQAICDIARDRVHKLDEEPEA